MRAGSDAINSPSGVEHDEEYATGRRQLNFGPDSPASSKDSDDDDAQEPFFSTVSYIQDTQLRLDDDSFSSRSSASRFRCAPRNEEEEDSSIHSEQQGSPTGSHTSRQSALARRFLQETFEDEPEAAVETTSRPHNSDIFAFLSSTGSNNNNNNSNSPKDMWKQHSERGHRCAVDQSINLMNTDENASYNSDPPPHKSHMDALKQPFSFLLSQNTTNVPSIREAKPFIDIDLNNNTSGRKGSSSSLQKTNDQSDKKKKQYILLILLGCLLAVSTTWIVSLSVPHHHRKILPPEEVQEGMDLPVGAGHNVPMGGVQSISGPEDNDEGEDNKNTADDNKAEIAGLAKKKIVVEAKKEHKAEDTTLLLDTSGVDADGTRTSAIQYLLEQRGIVSPDSTNNEFQDHDSPLFKALQWISILDEAQYVIPGYDTTPSEHDWQHLHQLFERFALAVLYFELKPDDKAYKDYKGSPKEQDNRLEFDLKWTLRDHVCDWPGVQCEGGRVAALNLTRSLLTGTVPLEALDGVALPHLTSLDISHNHIHGSLPEIPDIRRWRWSTGEPNIPALQHLQMRHNRLTGNLESLARYKSLTFVDLSYNSFDSVIPDSLAYLSRLEYLSLNDNRFNGEIPASLGSLPNLQMLFLDDNRLEGTVPASLGNLVQLESLRLLENHLTGSVPEEICQLRTEGKLSFLIADCSSGHIICDCCTRCWRD